MIDQAELTEKKDALIATARRCFDLGLQTNAGGNLSVALDTADASVIKPSGVGFAECSRENLQVVLPPVVKMLRHLDKHQPDVIHISTPGPVGCVGFLAAKMLRLPVLGVYHTAIPAYVAQHD